jgi:sodium transport system permease protein
MRRTLEHIGIVFQKEVRDNLRDRRSLFSALVSALIGPAILVSMIMIIGKTILNEARSKELQLPVIGAEHAPGLIQYLEQNYVRIIAGPTDPEREVSEGNLEVVLIIPDNYAEDFRAGRPATLRIVLDSSRQSSIPTVERARILIHAYENQISNLRLLARGVNPVITNPIALERVDVSTPQSQVTIFLNMMPYFVILVVFVGGMYVVIDTTAGERERGSLEPLLINPVSRQAFVLGKLTAATPFAAFAVFLTLLAFALAFNLLPLEDYIGYQITIDPRTLVGIFFIALPMILLASSLQMIVATFTRSFKEAQTYVAFLPLIPALPGIGLAFLPVKPGPTNMLIPTFGQQLLINQLMRGEPLDPLLVLISTVSTIILAMIFIFIAVKLYEHERILFGTK